MIPQTFEQWENCLLKDCKIKLTQEFSEQRLAVYQDTACEETKKFISLYGIQHHKNIILWLNQIKNSFY